MMAGNLERIIAGLQSVNTAANEATGKMQVVSNANAAIQQQLAKIQAQTRDAGKEADRLAQKMSGVRIPTIRGNTATATGTVMTQNQFRSSGLGTADLTELAERERISNP